MPETPDHFCTLTRDSLYGWMQCGECGEWWRSVPRDLLTFVFTRTALRKRLNRYRQDIGLGKYADLREAVRATAKAEAAKQAKEREAYRRKCFRQKKIQEDRAYRFYRKKFAGLPCEYCGDPDRRGVDHRIPLAQGGPTEFWNMAPACQHCNSEKGDCTPEQWREWRLSKGMPWPPLPSPQPNWSQWAGRRTPAGSTRTGSS